MAAESLIDKALSIRKEISKLQYDINCEGYNIDLESVLIGFEGCIAALEKYEALREQS